MRSSIRVICEKMRTLPALAQPRQHAVHELELAALLHELLRGREHDAPRLNRR